MRYNRKDVQKLPLLQPVLTVDKSRVTLHHNIPLAIFAFERRMLRPEHVVCIFYSILNQFYLFYQYLIDGAVDAEIWIGTCKSLLRCLLLLISTLTDRYHILLS